MIDVRERAAPSTARATDIRLPLNGWYVAATAAEVGRALLERWVLDRPLVLYRTEAGAAVALAGRCAHRQYALWRGRLEGDSIECGYHGITYGSDGICTRIPSQERIPAAFRVHRYPLVERGDWLWIWMGDPARADATTIPEQWQCNPAWRTVTSITTMNARPLLLIENLMDLSHETFVHNDSIGNREVAETPIETHVNGDIVQGSRLIRNSAVAPFHVKLGIVGPIERDQIVEFVPPAFVIVHSTIRDANGAVWRWKVLDAIVPEREGRVRYYWGVSRDFRLDDLEHDAFWISGTSRVFDQDIGVLDLQETMLQARDAPPEASVAADGPALQTRIVMRRLEAKEAAEFGSVQG